MVALPGSLQMYSSWRVQMDQGMLVRILKKLMTVVIERGNGEPLGVVSYSSYRLAGKC